MARKKNPELESLRKQVAARQKAVGKKASRMKNKNNADIAGTNLDPRKSMATVNRLNRAQLKSQLAKLDKFMDRKTQYYGDASGNLYPPGAFESYKRAEAAVNRLKKKSFDKIKDIKAPGAGGLTIEQRHKVVTPDRPHAGNPAVNPFTFANRNSSSITSAKSLKFLQKNLERQLKTGFEADELLNDRRVAADMLRTLGKADWIDKLDNLSDFHFNILWSWTKFATDVSLPYELAKKGLQGESAAWHDDVLAENLKSAGELINDVQKIKLRR